MGSKSGISGRYHDFLKFLGLLPTGVITKQGEVTMLTDKQRKDIDDSGIIADWQLPFYLEGKLTTKPEYADDGSSRQERTFQTMYEAYKANMKKAQKESHKKRYT